MLPVITTITAGGRKREIAWAEETVDIKDYGQARQLTLFEHGQVALQVLGADEGACGRERLPYRVVAGGHPVLNPSWSGDGHDPIVPSGSRCASGSATALACQQSTSSGRWLRICERAVTKSAYARVASGRNTAAR